jgi:hypothetical protein
VGVRRAVRARSVGFSADRPRPGRRSDDGQTILLPVWAGPENALLSRRFRLSLGEFEPPALSALSGDVCWCQPGVLPGRPCGGKLGGQEPVCEPHCCHPSSHQPKIRCAAQEASSYRQCPASSADQRLCRVSGFTGSPASFFPIAADLRIPRSWPRENRALSVWRP